MSTSVTLPELGESVTEGTITRWLKQVGDKVETDEPLLEVSTDKVDTEVPSPASGVLLEIKAQEDETVEVGAELAVIGDEGEEPAGDSGSDDAASQEPAQEDAAQEDTEEEEAAPAQEESAEQPADDTEGDTEAAAREEAESEGSEDAAAKPAKPKGKSSGKGTEVPLPELGESVTEGTVSRWLKQVGDEVAEDEALVEISTDKVDTEVPSPAAGTLTEIKVQEDETISVGDVLCVIGGASDAADDDDDEPADDGASEKSTEAGEGDKPTEDGTTDSSTDAQTVDEPEEQAEAGDEGGQEPIPAPADGDEDEKPAPKAEPKKEAPKQEAPKQEAPKQEAPKQEAPKQEQPKQEQPKPAAPRASGGDSDAYVTPLVRKLAAEHDVDLSQVKGTGVGGRIRKQDVLAAAEDAKQAPAAEEPAAPTTKSEPSEEASKLRGTTEKLPRIRQIIAKRMTESLQVSAQLTATVEVDMTAISRIRAKVKDEFKQRNGASLSYLPFITKAAVEALRQFPKLNATIDTEAKSVTYSDVEHIGMAVDTSRGLMVPVIHDAGDLNLSGIAKRIAELADKTRNNKIAPEDLTGGTFTITNYGSAGTLFDTPIINQPQVGILGTGALVKRPMVMSDEKLGDTIAIRDMMYLSLTYDHRLIDGSEAARFLSYVKARLEEGDFGAEFGI